MNFTSYSSSFTSFIDFILYFILYNPYWSSSLGTNVTEFCKERRESSVSVVVISSLPLNNFPLCEGWDMHLGNWVILTSILPSVSAFTNSDLNKSSNLNWYELKILIKVFSSSIEYSYGILKTKTISVASGLFWP